MTPTRPADIFSLVADIGGTNTRVALSRGAHLIKDTIRRYRNADHGDLASVLSRFLSEMGGVDCKSACVAVAGPVRDGCARMTNLDWVLDLATLEQATRADNVSLLNDLQAQGYALGRLAQDHLRPILTAPVPPANATRLVIGVGTGFNTAAVFEVAGTRLVTPSETGHTNFPALTPEDCALADFVARRHGFPGLDDIVSGRGLENTYAWLTRDDSARAPLKAAEIMDALARGDDPAAIAAVAQFIRMLGRVAGNLALTYLPFGGIYLAGGVARAMAPHLAQFDFAACFADKGRFVDFMAAFPLSVIEDDYAALTGCAAQLDQLDAP